MVSWYKSIVMFLSGFFCGVGLVVVGLMLELASVKVAGVIA